jgi:hypothetical protein
MFEDDRSTRERRIRVREKEEVMSRQTDLRPNAIYTAGARVMRHAIGEVRDGLDVVISLLQIIARLVGHCRRRSVRALHEYFSMSADRVIAMGSEEIYGPYFWLVVAWAVSILVAAWLSYGR